MAALMSTNTQFSNLENIILNPSETDLLLLPFDTVNDNFYDPNNIYYYDYVTPPPLPPPSLDPLFNSLPPLPESFYCSELDPHPKRHHRYEGEEEGGGGSGYLDNNGFFFPGLPELFSLPPPPQLDVSYGDGGGRRDVSAQSKAARERRRRITEKTVELGRAVPGGSKLNTAEMLGAAFKYVKFLQAQLGILRFMSSLHQEMKEEVDEGDMEELQTLLASPTVQEKLYQEDKCLVLTRSLDLLSKHQSLLGPSQPSISDDLKQIQPSDS